MNKPFLATAHLSFAVPKSDTTLELLSNCPGFLGGVACSKVYTVNIFYGVLLTGRVGVNRIDSESIHRSILMCRQK